MSIFESLAAEVDNLRRSPHIEVLFHKNRLSDATDLRSDLEAILSLELPPPVLDSVEIDDDLHVYWKSTLHTEDAAVFGEFFLRSVLLFAPRSQLNEIFQSRRYAAIGDMKKMRVFDYYAHNGGPIYALMQVVGRKIDDRVYIFNERDVFTTTLNYESYLQVLLRTRGFLFWQYLYCENPQLHDYEVSAIGRGLDFVEQEFPGDDYGELRRRLQALERST